MQRSLVASALTALLISPAVPSVAAEPPAPTQMDSPATVAFALDVPAQAPKKTTFESTATLSTPDGPMVGVPVFLAQKNGETHTRVAQSVTDTAGRTVFRVPASTADSATFRVETDTPTDGAGEFTVRYVNHDARVRLTVPRKVVDGRTVNVTGSASSKVTGEPLAGAKVNLQTRKAHGDWRTVKTAKTRKTGTTTFKVRPRVNTTYRLQVPSGRWWNTGVSPSKKVVNVPPGKPVALPKGAPRPNQLPIALVRANTPGANPVITRIPSKVWSHMNGKSWRPGCMPRRNLRLVRVNHYGYDGYRYRGELVVAASVAPRVAAAFKDIHAAKLPLRAIMRADHFGYSTRLRGADDYKVMAAGVTSAFNCRDVVGRPGVKSPHATGRSIDLNPFENPYYSRLDGWVPNRWWVGRSHSRVAWRSKNHRMVRILAKNGIRWTYGTSDAHHFDA